MVWIDITTSTRFVSFCTIFKYHKWSQHTCNREYQNYFWKFDITFLLLIMHPRGSLFAFLASPKSNMRIHKCIVQQTKKWIDEWQVVLNPICIVVLNSLFRGVQRLV